MAIKFSKSLGSRVDGGSSTHLIAALAAQAARIAIASDTDITDSSGGVASSVRKLVAVSPVLVNVAAAGSNLADKTTTEAALNLVKDAILELNTKAASLATKLGLTPLTYNGGGTATDGTLTAIPSTVTGAATGVKALETGASLSALNDAFASVAGLINSVALATGVDILDISDLKGSWVQTVPVITVAGGTAATPGVTKAVVDAALVAYKANIATAAAVLNAITGNTVPLVLVVA